MKGERLVLVTDFSSLRAGMIVVTKNCGWCGKDHRGMLTRFRSVDDGVCKVPGNILLRLARWVFVPTAACGADCVSERQVRLRVLYRVLDGLDQPATTTDEKRPERVR